MGQCILGNDPNCLMLMETPGCCFSYVQGASCFVLRSTVAVFVTVASRA